MFSISVHAIDDVLALLIAIVPLFIGVHKDTKALGIVLAIVTVVLDYVFVGYISIIFSIVASIYIIEKVRKDRYKILLDKARR